MWVEFVGRFHPVIVHLPIGILISAFILEFMAVFPRFRKVRNAVLPMLVAGTLFAWLACATGLALRQERGYDESLADWHQYLGLLTAVFATAHIFLRPYTKTKIIDVAKRRQVRVILFLPLMIVMTITGHLGGSLTHGEDFLSFPVEEDEANVDVAQQLSRIPNADSAILYEHVIKPIFDSRCIGCHSSRKQKGDLRLDSRDFILRGGKSGVLFSSVPDSSLLIRRLMLPEEDKHHMPPKERPQLRSVEINLIQSWIAEGASFDKKVSSYAQSSRIRNYIATASLKSTDTYVEDLDAPEADENIVRQLKNEGVVVLRLSTTSNGLVVNFANVRKPTKTQLSTLADLREQVVSLNLAFTSLSDSLMPLISALTNLRTLSLNNTAVTDKSLEALKPLSNLRVLNVSNTKISDAVWLVVDQLPKLSNVYVFQTNVTRQGVIDYIRQHSKVAVDTGNYRLAPLATDTIIHKRKS